jgi:hypothetical protein
LHTLLNHVDIKTSLGSRRLRVGDRTHVAASRTRPSKELGAANGKIADDEENGANYMDERTVHAHANYMDERTVHALQKRTDVMNTYEYSMYQYQDLGLS